MSIRFHHRFQDPTCDISSLDGMHIEGEGVDLETLFSCGRKLEALGEAVPATTACSGSDVVVNRLLEAHRQNRGVSEKQRRNRKVVSFRCFPFTEDVLRCSSAPAFAASHPAGALCSSLIFHSFAALSGHLVGGIVAKRARGPSHVSVAPKSRISRAPKGF